MSVCSRIQLFVSFSFIAFCIWLDLAWRAGARGEIRGDFHQVSLFCIRNVTATASAAVADVTPAEILQSKRDWNSG